MTSVGVRAPGMESFPGRGFWPRLQGGSWADDELRASSDGGFGCSAVVTVRSQAGVRRRTPLQFFSKSTARGRHGDFNNGNASGKHASQRVGLSALRARSTGISPIRSMVLGSFGHFSPRKNTLSHLPAARCMQRSLSDRLDRCFLCFKHLRWLGPIRRSVRAPRHVTPTGISFFNPHREE